MKKRVFIIHGWGGSPKNDWIPWVKTQLEVLGYQVVAPLMPDTDIPRIKPWIDKLKGIVGKVRKDDILIGHSIGCQTILRFLEGLPPEQKVDKVISVAPWMTLTLTNLENEQASEIADPWLKTPINFSKVKSKANSFTAIFSDNDPFVPLKENLAQFKRELNTKVLVVSSRGHFIQDEGVTDLPEILKIMEIND